MSMRRITTGGLLKALNKYFPVTHDDIRSWIEDGSLPAWQNPTKKRGWYRIDVTKLPLFLAKLGMNDAQIDSFIKNIRHLSIEKPL